MRVLPAELGVTLVELMIALTIGLFVVAGVGQIFLSTRAAYNNQERNANIQENGRFAMVFLQRSLRKAGFPKSAGLNAFTDTPGNVLCPMAVSSADCTNTSGGTCNNGTSLGDPNGSDRVAVCYQGASDCLGQAVASGVIVDTFFVNNDAATGVNRLMCRGSGNAQAQPLVDGIESLQIQYGQDTDDDGYASLYVRANEVSDWDKVVAVRVGILASTRSNDTAASAALGVVYGDTASDVQAYQVLETALAAGTLAQGTRGRVFVSTIELRNRTP